MEDTVASWLDGMGREQARLVLARCCGAERWVEAMITARPFGTRDAVTVAASRVFDTLERADWLQAFAAHPKIGDADSLRKKYAHNGAWSAQEQSGVDSALEDTIRDLAYYNGLYEGRHGFIFIVCATGKTAGEMLELLKARVNNSTDVEIVNASMEQRRITMLRLEKLTP